MINFNTSFFMTIIFLYKKNVNTLKFARVISFAHALVYACAIAVLYQKMSGQKVHPIDASPSRHQDAKWTAIVCTCQNRESANAFRKGEL